MKLKKEIWVGIFFIVGLLFMAFFVSADYMRSNVKYTQFESGRSFQEFDKSMCEAGQDFIIQIAPFGCTPTVVRSDLLEEQNVPVFCQLGATKINPLIEVEAIESISFTGEYPPEVSGIGFHPARAALGVEGNLNSPVLNNIGYVVIVLNKQSNVSSMPDFVQGNLTAKIRYDIKNAFGIGKASFHLPELSDSKWEEKYFQYGFWNGKGYLRAEGISEEKALISVYDMSQKKVSSVNLQKGETSNKIYLPGFDCLAGLQLKLNKVENPTTRARLRVNADVVEVAEGEKFLENKCRVRNLEKQGLMQKISIDCHEDDGRQNFDLIISPKVVLNIGGEEKEVSVGDFLYTTADASKSVYLGYIGTKDDTTNAESLYTYFVAIPDLRKSRLDEDEILAIATHDALMKSDAGVGVGILDVISKGLEKFAAISINIGKLIITGESIKFVDYAEEKEIFGKSVKIIGFAGAQNVELDVESGDYYDKAMNDYEKIINSFAGEKHLEDESVTFGELALLGELKLARDAGQMMTMNELCNEFKAKYPNSRYKDELKDCDTGYRLSNYESTSNYVMINGRVNKISFDEIYEPSLEDYSVEIFVSNAGDYSGSKILQKNEMVRVSETEFFSLKELEEDHAVFNIGGIKEDIVTEIVSQSLKISLDDYKIVGKNNYNIRVDKINLKKSVKVSVIPNIDNAGTEANFGFKIGIEKSAIELSPEKTKDKIEELNETIVKWQETSDGLSKVVKGLKTACLGTGVAMTVKNFLANVGGKGIARQSVMREDGGWYNRCADYVSDNVYESQEECMAKEADNIEADVNDYYQEMQEQNEGIEDLQADITEKKFLSESVVDTDKFMEKYSPLVQKYLEDNFGENLEDPSNKNEPLEMSKVIGALSYDSWESYGNYDKEQLREIELYAKLRSNPDISPELREISEKRLYSLLSTVQEASNNYVERESFANKYGVDEVHYGSVEKLDEIKFTKDITFSSVASHFSGSSIPADSFVQFYKDKQTNKEYLIVLDNDYIVSQTYEIDGSVLTVKDAESINPLRLAFRKYDSFSYQNEFKSSSGDNVPIVRYYETEPYKGLPATVPFDLKKGWYAATKQVLPVLGNIQAFDKSGRVTSFWLCNVGENGREENIGGDDICEMINLGTGQPYNQFAGLSEHEAEETITAGVKAIEQASRQYKSGISRVNINVGYGNLNLKVGSPAVDIPDMQCQDFMSPKDCQLLFNVCDPVICPSSRCDLGGAYPVRDVIQSGIIGSIALCLPNIKEGIYIPVCLSGVQAGVDGYLSVLTSHRDCLQHSLETGEMVGVCDEIYSIHLCEFFWRQALPLANMIIPKMMEVFLGQNLHGGGEYLGVANAWENAENSVAYFTQSYAVNSYKAFKARSTEEVGGEICKAYVSGVYPEGSNLIDSLIEPDSPPQFHGRFDEIPFTSVTVPQTSHYKVFYHIFAGKDAGAYYQVYLSNPKPGSFWQGSTRRIVDSGYIGKGGYASETKDFTAPTGYTEMCISVNDQEECGFKQVSTSFAVEYAEEQYIASQVEEVDIKTEKGCISGSASAYSLLSPNLQAGAEEMISPEIYNRGITRICASDDPGKGTDVYAGGEGARWIEVGYCDDRKIKCWLDTQSVSDVIKNTDVEEDVLETVAQNQLDILRNKEGYISRTEFLSEVEEIEKEGDLHTKIDLINQIFNQVFLNSEKAYLFFLRGDAYSGLVFGKYRELKETEKEEVEEEPEVGEESGEAVGLIGPRQKVLDIAEELEGTIVPGKECANCWTAASYIYEEAGVVHNCMYADADGKQYSVDNIKINMVASSTATFQVARYPERDCLLNRETENINEDAKLDALRSGDLLSAYYGITSSYPNGAPHNIIFIEWVDKDKRIANVFDWNGDLLSNGEKDLAGKRCASADFYPGKNYCKTYRYYEEDLSDDKHPVYMFWRPMGVSRETWTLDSAIEKVRTLRLTYSENKEFVDQLYEDGILTEKEYKDMIGEGFLNKENDMIYLKNLLLKKQIV